MDMTDQYNTKLTPKQEKQFEKWRATLPKEQQSTYDYDLRGAWKDGLNNNNNPAHHFSDKYKKPNHPTFSRQSIYSGKNGYQGGHWIEHNGHWGFVPSDTNMKMMDPNDLQRYFKQVEPGNEILWFGQ